MCIFLSAEGNFFILRVSAITIFGPAGKGGNGPADPSRPADRKKFQLFRNLLKENEKILELLKKNENIWELFHENLPQKIIFRTFMARLRGPSTFGPARPAGRPPPARPVATFGVNP